MSGKPDDLRLSMSEKLQLVRRLAGQRLNGSAGDAARNGHAGTETHELADAESVRRMKIAREAAVMLGIEEPFFRLHEATAGAETVIAGQTYINFASYNYVGLNGDPRVAAAAKEAIDRYGTSCSASRLVSGERPIHRELEKRLAEFHETEDCVAFVSGHATNVTVIGNLLGKNDLILHDEFIHNSALQGAQLSGAQRVIFPHNDAEAADRLLAAQRARHGRALLVIEGHYSMDGDVPDLPAFVAVAKRHRCFLFVDEAHSVGVLGATGRGLAEHFGMAPSAVDIWMGTLSKSLASCGGYVACGRELADYLRFTAPGFVYSVGMPPPVAAAAEAALELLIAEPQRVARLHANGRRFLTAAKAAGLNTGQSAGLAIVPILTGSSIVAARLSDALFRRGINVQPIIYPAVAESGARLRFFLSSEHSAAQIDATIAALIEETARIRTHTVELAALATRMRQAE